ncbi:MAG TPA: DUF4386 domain-containing protein [Phycisphaerales bacterium]|nr:DUF4386 domain-containing protein [Phycisphaerales bacterium]
MNAPPVAPRSARVAAGVLLISTPILFTICFTLLQLHFSYPDILREPAPHILERFHAARHQLLPMWYGMMLSALLFVALAIACSRVFTRNTTTSLVLGVIAGLVQAIGLARWVFAVPALASSLADPSASPPRREAILTTFDTMHALLGVGLGEHMGYLFTTAWTLTIAHALRQSNRWLATSGALCGLGILVGVAEPLGQSWAGTVNALAYSAWSLWLICLGIMVLRDRTDHHPA